MALQKLLPGKPRVAVAVLLILAAAAVLYVACCWSPSIPFVYNDSRAAWIMYPRGVSTRLVLTDPDAVPTICFTKEFRVSVAPKNVILYVKAFRSFRLYVNGLSVDVGDGRSENWKVTARTDISEYIGRGVNTVRVDVQNPGGPALLYMYIKGLRNPVATDTTWRAAMDSGAPVRPMLADDTRLNPESSSLPTPIQEFARKWKVMLLLFLLSVLASFVGRFLIRGRAVASLPLVLLTAISAAWILLFFYKMMRIPLYAGFDVLQHINYILYILQNRQVPLATDGWSMYHPPLFYLLSASLFAVLRRFVCDETMTAIRYIRIIPFLCGIGSVWVTYALGRRLFKDDHVKVCFAPPAGRAWVVGPRDGSHVAGRDRPHG